MEAVVMTVIVPQVPSEQPSPQADEALSVAFLQFADQTFCHVISCSALHFLCISASCFVPIKWRLLGLYFKHFFCPEVSSLFPEWVAKGSRFALGSLDIAFVFATDSNRLQPSAIIALWPCLRGVLQQCSLFWRFQMLRNLAPRGKLGTSRHSNMLHNVGRI